jgi:hypothetical protein
MYASQNRGVSNLTITVSILTITVSILDITASGMDLETYFESAGFVSKNDY